MKINDLFEAPRRSKVPIAVSSIREFALKAADASLIKYKGEEWHYVDGESHDEKAIHQWAVFDDNEDDHQDYPRNYPRSIYKSIHIEYWNDKPYYTAQVDGSGNVTIEYSILDPKRYLLDSFELNSLEKKEQVIKKILELYRLLMRGSPEIDIQFIRRILEAAKDCGLDWPELKAIEKSVKHYG